MRSNSAFLRQGSVSRSLSFVLNPCATERSIVCSWLSGRLKQMLGSGVRYK